MGRNIFSIATMKGQSFGLRVGVAGSSVLTDSMEPLSDFTVIFVAFLKVFVNLYDIANIFQCSARLPPYLLENHLMTFTSDSAMRFMSR